MIALVDIDKLVRLRQSEYYSNMVADKGGEYVRHDDLKTNVDVEALVASLLGSIIDKRPVGYDMYGPLTRQEITKAFKELFK